MTPHFQGLPRPLLEMAAPTLANLNCLTPAVAIAQPVSGEIPAQPLATFSSLNRLWTVPSHAACGELAVPQPGFVPSPDAPSESIFARFEDLAPETATLPWAAASLEIPKVSAAAATSTFSAESAWSLAGPTTLGATLIAVEYPDSSSLPLHRPKTLSTAWAAFPVPASPALPIAVPIEHPAQSGAVGEWPAHAALAALPAALLPFPPVDTGRPLLKEPAPSPVHWLARTLPLLLSLSGPRLRIKPPGGAPTFAKVRVKDFVWPDFAAGCDSLFTPDQPFRFHEMPFLPRGTTDMAVGDVLNGEIIQDLPLFFVDDRFDSILRPQALAEAIEEYMSQSAAAPGNLFNRPGTNTPFVPPTPTAQPPKMPIVAAPKPADPPSSWQQAARAMHEGEQQVGPQPCAVPFTKPVHPASAAPAVASSFDRKPVLEGKPVTAVPVVSEPRKGTEVALHTPSEAPVPFVRNEPLGNPGQPQPPASEGAQFEWRRDHPQQGPPPPAGHSSVSINTTITVEGNSAGVVVESAVRISLGDRGGSRKPKSDAVEKFADGENLEQTHVRMEPPEGLPEFLAEEPKLRPILQPISPSADSIQWPKFSVTPMRRRIAFGPPPGLFFGASNSAVRSRPESKPLPPKKSMGGFLFKKLTNS